MTLDGSGSYDPDGGLIVSYTWLLPTGGTVTGATTTVRLTIGIHQIILTVKDDEGSADKDTVIITIIDTAHTPVPAIKHAAFFADNGKGSVSRVEIRYTKALATAEIPDSIQICWPDVSTQRRYEENNIV